MDLPPREVVGRVYQTVRWTDALTYRQAKRMLDVVPYVGLDDAIEALQSAPEDTSVAIHPFADVVIIDIDEDGDAVRELLSRYEGLAYIWRTRRGWKAVVRWGGRMASGKALLASGIVAEVWSADGRAVSQFMPVGRHIAFGFAALDGDTDLRSIVRKIITLPVLMPTEHIPLMPVHTGKWLRVREGDMPVGSVIAALSADPTLLPDVAKALSLYGGIYYDGVMEALSVIVSKK